jgi:hypothetical protein
MQLIRGTTPTIVITVQTELDLHQVSQVWIYLSQQNKVKVDKLVSDVEFDYDHRIINVTLSQEDTLALRAGDALFQIRLLLMDDTALATIASNVEVIEVYKDGVISEDQSSG